MATRSYRLGRRGEAAEETRRRIVEATFALHSEQGIVATSMKQIAERAGVSVGTVYHHFPTYDEAIDACGAFTRSLVPLPDPAAIAGAEDPAERVRRLVASVFALYEQVPVYARVRCEMDQVPQVAAFVREEEAYRLTLVRAALGEPSPPEDRIAAISALLDAAVYEALRRAGLTTTRAVDEIARIITASLGDA